MQHIITDLAGAKYIRFSAVDNGHHPHLKSVLYNRKVCYDNCANLLIIHTSRNAVSYWSEASTDYVALNSNNAFGIPDA